MSKKQVHLNSKELKDFLTHMINNNRFLEVNNKKKIAVEIMGESGLGKTSLALQLANELGLNFVKLNLSQIEELGDLVGYPVRQFELCKYDVSHVPAQTVTENVSIPVTKKVKKLIKEVVTITAEKEEMVTETVMEERSVKKQVLESGRMVMKEVLTQIPVTKEVKKMVPYTYDEEIEVEKEVDEIVFETVSQEVPVQNQNQSLAGCIWVDEQATEEYVKQGFNFTGNKRMSYCPPEWIANKEGGGILIIDDYNRAD